MSSTSRFISPRGLLGREDEGTPIVRNVESYLPSDTALNPGILESSCQAGSSVPVNFRCMFIAGCVIFFRTRVC